MCASFGGHFFIDRSVCLNFRMITAVYEDTNVWLARIFHRLALLIKMDMD